MRRGRSLLAAVLALGILAFAAWAQQKEGDDARAVLERVSHTYRQLTSYQFEGMVGISMLMQGKRQGFEFPVVAAAASGGRSRTELRNPMMGISVISDGKNTTTYSQQLNQFTRKAGTPPASHPDSAFAPVLPLPEASPIARYFYLTKGIENARRLGATTLDVSGRPVPCDLVAVDFTHPAGNQTRYSPTILWIDRARSVVVRESTTVSVDNAAQGHMEMTQTTIYPITRINESLADSLWTFSPPPGAQLVEELKPQGPQGMREPSLEGQKATDFTLTSLDGKSYTLSKLRGKVVMLDFWATWCGPCRIEMPHVQKLHSEFKTKGLVVFGVNYGETSSRVKPFIAKNAYDFTILMDTRQEVGSHYEVNGIPALFIIDKDGVIRSHFVGVRDEGQLRQALAAVGVK
jgi:peroxiredoxin/outer membrane lipoprotein-sorting protein